MNILAQKLWEEFQIKIQTVIRSDGLQVRRSDDRTVSRREKLPLLLLIAVALEKQIATMMILAIPISNAPC